MVASSPIKSVNQLMHRCWSQRDTGTYSFMKCRFYKAVYFHMSSFFQTDLFFKFIFVNLNIK